MIFRLNPMLSQVYKASFFLRRRRKLGMEQKRMKTRKSLLTLKNPMRMMIETCMFVVAVLEWLFLVNPNLVKIKNEWMNKLLNIVRTIEGGNDCSPWQDVERMLKL